METSLFLQVRLVLAACEEMRPAEAKIENVKALLLMILNDIDPSRFKKGK